MESAVPIYQILLLINKKAKRKEVKETLCQALGCSRENLYLKMRATSSSKYRFTEEEESIIAETLGVKLNEIFFHTTMQPA